jgi:hypothetical protein
MTDNIYNNRFDDKQAFKAVRRKCLCCGKKLGLDSKKFCCGKTYEWDSLTRLEIVPVLAKNEEEAYIIANS